MALQLSKLSPMHCGQLLRAKPAKVRCPWPLPLAPAALDQEKRDVYVLVCVYNGFEIEYEYMYICICISRKELYLYCAQLWAHVSWWSVHHRHAKARCQPPGCCFCRDCRVLSWDRTVCCAMCGKQNSLVLSPSILIQPTQPETLESLWLWQQTTRDEGTTEIGDDGCRVSWYQAGAHHTETVRRSSWSVSWLLRTSQNLSWVAESFGCCKRSHGLSRFWPLKGSLGGGCCALATSKGVGFSSGQERPSSGNWVAVCSSTTFLSHFVCYIIPIIHYQVSQVSTCKYYLCYRFFQRFLTSLCSSLFDAVGSHPTCYSVRRRKKIQARSAPSFDFFQQHLFPTIVY